MILLQSYDATRDILIDVDVPLIYAVKDKSTGVITLGRFFEEDLSADFFNLFLRMLEKGICNLSNHLYLVQFHSDEFKDCELTATFTIVNREFENRKMRLVGSENIARYLRTHDVPDNFNITVSK